MFVKMFHKFWRGGLVQKLLERTRNIRPKNIVLTTAAGATLFVLPYISGCTAEQIGQQADNMFKGLDDTPKSTVYAAGSSIFEYNASNPDIPLNERRGHAALSGLYGTLAQQEAMKEAAREGKSEVNVNIYPNTNQNPVPEKKEQNLPYLSVLNEADDRGVSFCLWKDLNYNNKIDLDKEEIFPTNIFYKEDLIIAVTKIPKHTKTIQCLIYDITSPSENVIVEGYRMQPDGNQILDEDTFKFGDLHTGKIASAYKSLPIGTKKYEFKVFREGEDKPFATTNFFINYDLTADQVRR